MVNKNTLRVTGLRQAITIEETAEALHHMLMQISFAVAFQDKLSAITDAKLELERIAEELKDIFTEEKTA